MRLLLCLALAGCAATVTVAPAPPRVVADFYGVPLTSDVMFLVDRSTSMSGDKLVETKRALQATIDRMPDGAHVGIVFFDDAVTVLADRDRDFDGRKEAPRDAKRPPARESDRVILTAATRQHLHRFVTSIEVRRAVGTSPVQQVFGWSFADHASHHLVLVSGGLAPSSHDRSAILDQVAHLRRSGVRIDTVAIGRDQDVSLLQQIAATAGGVAVIHE